MKYAIFETVKSKSNLSGYTVFLSKAQTLLEEYGRPQEPYKGIVLCSLPNETEIFGELISQANYYEVAYRVLYFSEEPTVFESKPKM